MEVHLKFLNSHIYPSPACKPNQITRHWQTPLACTHLVHDLLEALAKVLFSAFGSPCPSSLGLRIGGILIKPVMQKTWNKYIISTRHNNSTNININTLMTLVVIIHIHHALTSLLASTLKIPDTWNKSYSRRFPQLSKAEKWNCRSMFPEMMRSSKTLLLPLLIPRNWCWKLPVTFCYIFSFLYNPIPQMLTTNVLSWSGVRGKNSWP